MTGLDVAAIRTTIGFSKSQFAQLLGVHVSTVYRWETAVGECKIDPLQLQILTVTRERLAGLKASAREGLVERLERGLLVGGSLFALGVLLTEVYGDLR